MIEPSYDESKMNSILVPSGEGSEEAIRIFTKDFDVPFAPA
jgi:hypothetical protein